MVDNALIHLTVTEFKDIVATAIERAVEPLNERLVKIESQQYSDISGVQRICKELHVDKTEVTDMYGNGCLGRAMWKKFGKRANAKITMVMPKGKRRYMALQMMPKIERQAFCELGPELAEAEWRKRGL